MSTAVSSNSVSEVAPAAALREVRVYSHSMVFYWWPVWAVGYVMALLTFLGGRPETNVAQTSEPVIMAMIHPNQNLGVIFVFTFLLVYLITHFAVRGIASLAVILALISVVITLAYFQLWDDIFDWLGRLAIYMNLGFYLFLSTAMFLIWGLATFVLVRLNYYVFRPGQLVHIRVWGGGEESFDTRGMSVHKMRDDLFRHWILGIGSGDINIAATGARKAEFTIHNVLFVERKLNKIQRLVALKPDDTPDAVFTAGQPE